jgi:bifunctional non-homologous end joining protein LigD
VLPKDPGLRETRWTEPQLIADVAFMEWTSDGSIRHPSFQGLREDKQAKDVVREQPASEARRAKPKPTSRTISKSKK